MALCIVGNPQDDSDLPNAGRLFCVSSERPSRCRAADECYELAPLHGRPSDKTTAVCALLSISDRRWGRSREVSFVSTMSPSDQSETSKSEWSASVCPPAADPDHGKGFVNFVPKGD